MTLSGYDRTSWRLIINEPAEGAWNMGVDEALLISIGKNESLPVLRLYAWEPACLSLGYSQPYQDINPDGIAENGWNVVRRVTGGRAILHTNELTYAVIAPYDEPIVAGSLLDSYNRISQGLLSALIHLGIQPHAQSRDKNKKKAKDPPNPICFEVPSNYEITVGRKKIIGSAQARKKMGIIQHGTLPLRGDLTLIIQALKFPDQTSRLQAKDRILDRAATVESILGYQISWDTAAKAIIHGFQETFNINFVGSSLSPDELNQAETLIKEKYACRDWTKRI